MLEVRVYHRENYNYTGQLPTDEYGNNFDTVFNNTKPCNYLAFDGKGINLLDENLKFYEDDDFMGYTLPHLSNISCEIEADYSEASLSLNLAPSLDAYPEKLTIQFYNDCCREIKIIYCNENGIAVTNETVSVKGNLVTHTFLRGYYRIYVQFTKTAEPYQYIRIESIIYGSINVFDKFTSHNLIEEINVLSDDLPINQFEATIVNPNHIEFAKKDPLVVFSNNKYYGSFYIINSQRISQNVYEVKAQNLIGVLDGEEYIDWVSTNKNLSGFIGELNSKIVIDDNKNYNIFGYIPANTKRYALCAACFGCGFMVDGSRNDKIYLKKIPTEISSTILTSDRRIIGSATFEKRDPIMYASITYPNSVDSSETGSVTLDANGDGWQFHYFEDAPVLVTKGPSGNALYRSADNYVEFKTESDTATFEYAKYKYLTNTELTYNTLVTDGGTKEYKNFQIRGGMVGNDGYITRISRIDDVQKYIQSRGIVTAKIRLRNEKVGDLIQIETAWDGIITGIITKMNIKFGYEDIADIEVLEWSL